MELFPENNNVGIFRGFREGGMEFHADLVLPYQNYFQRIPMHGQFVLVQLETPNEAVLGRITSFSSEGKLSFGSGEEFNIRSIQEQRKIPEDLREQYLKYRVNIRVLGVLYNKDADRLTFVPSHRRLPHVGSAVALPSGEILREICGHNIEGADIGHFALGEYIYADENQDIGIDESIRRESPEIVVRFPVDNLVSRRSFVFARAGFGKSNLNKLLFSELYRKTPTVEKRKGYRAPVGTIIFDPEGEYFWPDDKNRPGLCDVQHLQDNLVVFTDRKAPSSFYDSFIAGGIKLDIRKLPPSDVISIALPSEKQDQQNVAKLRSLSPAKWFDLVDLIDASGHGTDTKEIGKIIGVDHNKQEFEALAARSNMTNIVGKFHNKGSMFMELIIEALKAGKICIVDVSKMRGTQSFVFSGIILRQIFDHNQEEFTKAEPRAIPTIAVIEEAQSVLNERAASSEPYIAWVKEGRKYDLGALLITQQPGSIPAEILSQGDNWFIFHLLSSVDLMNVKKANAHFSDDILSSLLNEPIPGQGVFWSSVPGGKPYPVSTRVLLFENIYKAADPEYSRASVRTFATVLKEQWIARIEKAHASSQSEGGEKLEDNNLLDLEAFYRQKALDAIKGSEEIMGKLKGSGIPWGQINTVIKEVLIEYLEDASAGEKAFGLVAPTMEAIFGAQGRDWHTFKRGPNKSTYIKAGPESGN